MKSIARGLEWERTFWVDTIRTPAEASPWETTKDLYCALRSGELRKHVRCTRPFERYVCVLPILVVFATSACFVLDELDPTSPSSGGTAVLWRQDARSSGRGGRGWAVRREKRSDAHERGSNAMGRIQTQAAHCTIGASYSYGFYHATFN